MNHFRRAVSGLLSVALTGSLCTAWLPAAAAAAETTALEKPATGSIALTLSFDLPQRVDAVRERDITLHLSGNGKEVAVRLTDGKATGAEGLGVTTEALNVQGAPLTTEQRLGAYEAVLSGLPTGAYTMTVTGTGYAACSTEVELQDYSRHVLMSTADGTFSLGDFDNDGEVTAADRALLSGELGKTGSLAVYDLNGDGVVDITDLSYVNQTMDLGCEPKVLSTSAIVSARVEEDVVIRGGTAEDLFTPGETAVTVAPAEGKEELSIPITLDKPTEMSEITITTLAVNGAVQAGAALVVLEDDSTMTIPFDNTAPAGTYAISRAAGQSVISIDLGKKVAVKKVTITVTKVEGQTGDKPEFATVTQIAFLKDIVSEETKVDNQVKGLAATPGDKEVALVWNSAKNVTGYTVSYGTGKNSLNQTLAVNTNKATVSGLENNQIYYFQVTATNGDWSGTPSTVLAATPVPSSVPGAPSNLLVDAADTSLRVSWGKTKDAAYYQVFYRAKGEDAFRQWGGDIASTGAGLTGAYSVQVKADAAAEQWTAAKSGELSGDCLVAYFNKPGVASSDTRIWTYDAAVLELTGIPADAKVELLDYPGDRVDFYENAAVGVLKNDYRYGDEAGDVIKAGALVILGAYRGDPVYNYVSIEAVYNTTGEAAETNGVTTRTRPMNGYGLLFAEIPADGAVSDTSDGFFLFVPDLDAERKVNSQSGVTDAYPLEIRANFYRTDVPESNQGGHITSQTLWISFPDGGDEDHPVALPEIVLTGSAG